MSALVWYVLFRSSSATVLHCWIRWLLNFCDSERKTTGSNELLAKLGLLPGPWLSVWDLVNRLKS